MSALELERFKLALVMAGGLLAACAPTATKDAPTAPISPASVPASGPGRCNPVEFVAAIGVPTPAPESVSLPPYIAAINAMVKNCDPSMTVGTAHHTPGV